MPPRIVSVTVSGETICIGIDGGPPGGPTGFVRVAGGPMVPITVAAGQETDWVICHPVPPGGALLEVLIHGLGTEEDWICL